MDRLPVLPLGRLVVYPHVVLPMALTDPFAVQLIDEVVQGNKRLLLGVVKPLGGTEPEGGLRLTQDGRLLEDQVSVAVPALLSVRDTGLGLAPGVVVTATAV